MHKNKGPHTRYAKQVMGDVKYFLWNKVTVEELKAFLGFCVLMGINSLPGLVEA